MAATDTARPGSSRSPENPATGWAQDNCVQSVLSSYAEAIEQSRNERHAFDAAAHAYRLYCPNLSESVARAAVARIICWKE